MKFTVIVGAAVVAAIPLHQTAAEGPLKPFPALVDMPLNKPALVRKDAPTLIKRHGGRDGLIALVHPVTDGAVNPLAHDVKGILGGSEAGEQQVRDLSGDAAAELAHVIGGVAGNTEQGAGDAVAKMAPAVEGTVDDVQDSTDSLADLAKVVGG